MQPETRLEGLLDQTHTALLAGDIAALTGMAALLETLAATLPRLDRMTADRLQGKAHRNGQLLQAAARGLRAAKLRLAEITAGPTLTTYDARGQRESFTPLTTTAKRF